FLEFVSWAGKSEDKCIHSIYRDPTKWIKLQAITFDTVSRPSLVRIWPEDFGTQS
ncbi:hypothetical protein L916_10276, partial [Phytophthora nicotianae]